MIGIGVWSDFYGEVDGMVGEGGGYGDSERGDR